MAKQKKHKKNSNELESLELNLKKIIVGINLDLNKVYRILRKRKIW